MDIAKRHFLRGNFSGKHRPLLPPWSSGYEQFYDLCSRCGDCISACPENILFASSGGFPAVDFQKGECTFCNKCTDVCQTNALSVQKNSPPWQLDISIEQQCLCLDHSFCITCADQCETEAIRFEQRVGGSVTPTIDPAKCNGCGACVAPCPVNAISIQTMAV